MHLPRPVTPTGVPSGPSSSTGTGTGWTSAGEGAGSRPGQGGTTWAPAATEGRRPDRARPDVRFPPPPKRAGFTLAARPPRSSSDASPQGTRRICSSGPLPPVRTTVKDRLVAEKALNPRQTPFDLPARPGRPTFEVHLTPIVCYGTGDCEPQHGDPGGGGGDHRSLQPSLKLPSNPVHHGSRR